MTFYTGESRILRPSKIPVSGYYSTSGQYSVSLTPELYFKENKQFASLNLSFGHLVDKFYGIDSDGTETGDEPFVANSFNLQLGFQAPSLFQVSDRAGFFYRYRYYEVVDRRDNPYFDDPDVIGDEPGHISGLGFEWAWDSRQPTFWPETGVKNRLSYAAYPKELGSDFNHSKLELDLRQYRRLGERKVLATRIYVAAVGGNAPFYELPSLGGSSLLRGLYAGRYRDRSAVAVQGEFRWQSKGKLGAVGFIGAGGVAPSLSDQRLDEYRIAGGGGIRYLFNPTEKINLRADVGFGRHSNGIYFGLEEAF